MDGYPLTVNIGSWHFWIFPSTSETTLGKCPRYPNLFRATDSFKVRYCIEAGR
jgi:hypothetical protein